VFIRTQVLGLIFLDKTMTTAVFVVQPVHIDYPLFRHRLTQLHRLVKDIYIVFSDAQFLHNYQKFIVNSLPFVHFVSPMKTEPDWRDDAIRSILTRSIEADRILFLEQDFLFTDQFMPCILSAEFNDYDFIFYKEGDRYHPAFCLVRYDLIVRTDCNFAAKPPAYDHFGSFFKQVLNLSKYSLDIEQVGFKKQQDFCHLGGLTQNYHCLDNNQPLYKPNEFYTYNYLSINVPVIQDKHWYDRMGRINTDVSEKEFVPWMKQIFADTL